MIKGLQAKVIEAGIVPAQAVKLMKMWKMLDEDLPESGKQEQTENELLAFVSRIARILDETSEMPEMRETMLDLNEAAFSDRSEVCSVLIRKPGHYAWRDLRTMEDGHGRLIFRQDTPEEAEAAVEGNGVQYRSQLYWIIEVEPIYWGAVLRYKRCSVQAMPLRDRQLLEERDAKVPAVRGDDEES